MSALHIADTGLFVAMGHPSNSRYQAVRRFARRHDVTFVLPERVYEELTVDDPDLETPPIDEGWATVGTPLAAVRWYDGEPVGNSHLWGQFPALKDVVGAMIDKGAFTPSTASQYVKRTLAERVGDRQELFIQSWLNIF